MSSKRRLRRRECERKVRHPNHRAATYALHHTGAARVLPQGAGHLHVYQCRNCGGWHVGHERGTAAASGALQKAERRGHVRLRGAA